MFCPLKTTHVDSRNVMKWALGFMPVDEVCRLSAKGAKPFLGSPGAGFPEIF